MNKLSYKILKAKDKIASDRPDFRIIIDNKETNHFFIVEELKRSSKKAGTYTIVTCYCGETGCSGAEVEVSHRNNEILWEKMWHTDWDGESNEDEKKEFSFTENEIGHSFLKIGIPFKFDKKEYKALVNKLLGECKKLQERNKINL